MSTLLIVFDLVLVVWVIHALWRTHPFLTKQQRARRRAEVAARRDVVRLEAKQRL